MGNISMADAVRNRMAKIDIQAPNSVPAAVENEPQKTASNPMADVVRKRAATRKEGVTTVEPVVQRPVAQRVQEWVTTRKSELEKQIAEKTALLQQATGAGLTAGNIVQGTMATGRDALPTDRVKAALNLTTANTTVKQLQKDLAALRYDLQELEDPMKAELMAMGAIKEEDQRTRRQREIAAQTPAQQNAGYLGTSFVGGVTDVLGGFYNAADALIPDRNAKGEKISTPNISAFQKAKNTLESDVAAYGAEVSPAMQQYGGMIARGVGYTLPSTVLAMLPGVQALSTAAGGNMLANPQFWFSAIPMYGNGYVEAKEKGATEQEAQWFAALNAFAGATVEIGGGVQKIPTQEKTLLTWIRGALEEGGEEVLQGIIENLTAYGTYDRNKEGFSVTDPNAVFSVNRAAQEFGSGVMLGGILGGGQVLAGAALEGVNASGDYELSFAFGPSDQEAMQQDARRIIGILAEEFENIPAEPVFDAQYNEQVTTYSRKSDYIFEIFKKQGEKAYNPILGEVELGKTGAVKTTMHGFGKNKMTAAAIIKDVIEKGAIVRSTENYNSTGVTRHVLAARGAIDGSPAYVGVVVKEYPNQALTPKFYLHEAFVIEKKETGSPSMAAPQKSAITTGNPVSNTTVAQNAGGVNTHSMQDGGGNTQSAYLPADRFVDRMGADEQSPSHGDAVTAPFTQGGHAADAATMGAVQVDEAAVLERAVRSQLQRQQVDVSGLRKTDHRGESHYDVEAAIEQMEAALGTDEVLRRMYNATQIDRPTGRVTIDGQTVDANAFTDEYEQSLPDDPAALQPHIRALEERRAAEILRMEQEGTLEDYTQGGLKLDLQLFAAKRKWDLLQLDPGEEGKKARQFYEKRLRGTDANHHDELVELLAGRSETYNPISTQQQLDAADRNLRKDGYREKLIKRIGRYNTRDMFTPADVAAAQLLINDALNDGEYEVAMNLIAGLSRKGTELGRAVQAFSIMARLTPEGTLRMAQRTMKAEADYIIGDGASEGLDIMADDIADAIAQAEEQARRGGKTSSTASGPPSPQGEGRAVEDARPYGAAVEEPLTPARISEIQQVTNGVRTSFYDLTDEQVAKLEPLENRLYRELKNKSPFVRRRFGEWRIRDNTPVQIAAHAGMSRGVQKNTDTGWDIQVSGKVFNESKVHMSASVTGAQPYMPYINDIVQNAVLLDTCTIGEKKSGNSLCMHTLYALADIGNGPQLLKLYVEEMYNPGQGRTARRAYQLLNIENQSAGVQSSQQNAASPITLPTGTVSVADLIRIVKEKDSSYHPKAPEDVLVDDLAATEGNYLSRDDIAGIVERAINESTNVPEQVKRYVLKKIRKNDGGLAQRLYEMHQKGHLTADQTRRAMEEALELPTLSDADLKTLVDMSTRIQQLEKDPVAQADAMDELYDFLAAKMSVNMLDRLQAWRKFGMLANVKTHGRNLGSNLAYGGIRKMDDALSMALERMLRVKPEERGAYLGWSHTKHGQSILPALQEKAEIAVLEMQKRGAKYETGSGQLKQRRKFFGESKVGEALNTANHWNSDMLEKEDIIFFRPAYIDALGQMMTARGATEITNEMHEKAMQRALEATFRADNAISEVFSSLKRFQNNSKSGLRLFGHAMDVIVPFHKTPANIATQTVLHSPLGIAKGAFDLYNATKGKGSKDVATAINTMAKGVTGSALLAIGVLLGHLGLFNTGFGKTEKERAADELAGLQENAFVFGDVSVSFDWLQPAASPLIVGASIGKRLAEDGLSLGAVFGAVMDGTDSLFEMTMLQSLYDILGGYDAGATATAASIAENVVSQSVPTLLGQAARAIDPVQRKTTGDSDFMTIVNQVVAKIPGLTYLLDPELDVWGNEVYRTGKPGTGTAVLNAIQQFVLPSNVKVGTGRGDDVSAEILRLYKARGSKAIPTAVSRDDARDGQMDYVEINRRLGTVNRKAVEDFIRNDWPYAVQVDAGNGKTKKETKFYRNMTDEERVKVLSRIYNNTKKATTDPTSDQAADPYFQEIFRRLQ